MAKRLKVHSTLDRRLAPRIQEYMDAHTDFIDVETMALALQEQHGEYRRRQRAAFRLLVNEVYTGMVTAHGQQQLAVNVASVTDEVAPRSPGEPEASSDGAEAMSQDEARTTAEVSTTTQQAAKVAERNLAVKRRKLKRKHSSHEETSQSQWETKTSDVQLADVFGYDTVKDAIVDELSASRLLATDCKKDSQWSYSSGILLHGPSGCGKTHLARAIAGELGHPILEITATELVSGVSGDSENLLRQLFQTAPERGSCVLLIDKLESIGGRTEQAMKQMETRLVHQLACCCDDLYGSGSSPVLLIGITTSVDVLDLSLRMDGRFGKEFPIDYPDERSRRCMLEHFCKDMKFDANISVQQLAHNTPGYCGGDLKKLVKEAYVKALSRHLQQVHSDRRYLVHYKTPEEHLCDLSFQITADDIEVARSTIVPAGQKEEYACVPGVTWSDVGALDNVKKQLHKAVLRRVHRPELHKSLGLSTSTGVLLTGPPGCGKTLVAEAIANESAMNFISVKGPELFNMYVGETERRVRRLFERARNSRPCVIFFDEIDSLAPQRSSSSESNSASRVVNQLLTEMDGVNERAQVFIIGATNRPGALDKALLRTGRLDTILYVGMPDAEARAAILRAQTKNGTRPPLADDVDLAAIAGDARCEGLSGSDLKHLIYEACSAAIDEDDLSASESSHSAANGTAPAAPGTPSAIVEDDGGEPPRIELRAQHFEVALSCIQPSVSAEDQLEYEMAAMEMRRAVRG